MKYLFCMNSCCYYYSGNEIFPAYYREKTVNYLNFFKSGRKHFIARVDRCRFIPLFPCTGKAMVVGLYGRAKDRVLMIGCRIR